MAPSLTQLNEERARRFDPLPPKPDWRVVRLIHRAPESFVAFAQLALNENERWGQRSVRVGELPLGFPEKLVQSNGIFSINGFYRKGTRAAHNASHLNAAWVDLDFRAMSWEEGVEALFELVDSGVIPQPSLLFRSGRGMWSFWLLRADEEPLLPPKAHFANRQLQRQINERVVELVKAHAPQLRPDPAAVDAAHCVRVPGSLSLHPDAMREVIAFANRDQKGNDRFFTLGELAALVGLGAAPKRRLAGRTSNRTEKQRAAAAANAGKLTGERLSDLIRLERSRDGFREGDRNLAAFILATLLFQVRHAHAEVEEEIASLASRCRPPLSKPELRSAVKSAATKKHRFRNLTVVKWLGITQEEADRLDLLQFRPDFMPKRREPTGRNPAAERRRAALRQIEAESPGLSLRALAAELQRQGHACSPQTVANDRKAIRKEEDNRADDMLLAA